ncbi:hypothetical protein FD754_007870, partial [Muntiacus muntjak]
VLQKRPPAGSLFSLPSLCVSTTLLSERPSRPLLEYIDLICGDDKEPRTYCSDGDFLHFLNAKKVKTDTESIDSNKNYCGLSKSKESDFKYAEQPIIEEKPSSSSKEKMDNLVLPDCWNEKQVVMFTEQYKWLEIKEDLGSKAEDHVHSSRKKKIKEHDISKAHGKIQDLLKESINDSVSNLTVYSLVKHSRPLSDIAEHVAKEMKMTTFKDIIEEKVKICVTVDEASTSVPAPATLFVTLKELVSATVGSNLIAFCPDGANTMVGRKSGVATKLLESFPESIIWNCLNHRSHLSLDDSISEIKQVNHLRIFLDKNCSNYHPPNTSQNKLLGDVPKDLEIEAACTACYCCVASVSCVYLHCSLSHSGLAKRLANSPMNLNLDIPFNRNHKFNALSRNMLLENIIQHMNLCLLPNRKHDESIFNYFDLLEPSTCYSCETLKFEIDLNDFGEFVNNNIKSNNVSVPKTIQKANSYAEAERGFNLLNIICTRVRNSLTIGHISDLMTINLLGKELAGWDATAFVKSWSNCNHRLAVDSRVRQEPTKACRSQMALWNLQ